MRGVNLTGFRFLAVFLLELSLRIARNVSVRARFQSRYVAYEFLLLGLDL